MQQGNVAVLPVRIICENKLLFVQTGKILKV